MLDNLQILQECYSRNTLIPVIGSGISVPFGLPDWRTLIEKAAEHFSVPSYKVTAMKEHLDQYEYVDAVDIILEEGISEFQLQQFVSDCMYQAKKSAAPAESNYTDLAKLSKVRYMTTNYDQYMNDIVGAKTFCLEEFEKMPVNQFGYSPYDNTVIPLHGEISRPESIVLSRKSYDDLYGSDKFKEEFQQLRTRFTFLFMGFSFDDEHVRLLFDKVLQRFEAQHFILFDKSVGVKDADKVDFLRSRYGVETVYYDSSHGGHTKAISAWFQDILKLRDEDVDLKTFTKLPKADELVLEAGEQPIVEQGREFIRQEKLAELYTLYSAEYGLADFKHRSVMFQIEVVCGLLWYYGFQRKDKESYKIIDKALADPVLSAHSDKLAFMYGQLLWNTREFGKGISILEHCEGDSKLIQLLLDILYVYKRFLPEQEKISGNIPVYGMEDRTKEEQEEYHCAYLELKKKYINPETYNLKNLQNYEDRDSQQIAYYWLGVTAGQLFHEHEDAIQYLLRSCELEPRMVVHEELAHNYFALASEGIRYVKNPKKYQLDMNLLLKAKIRFQYVMNFSDETAVHSMYEKSGFAYLQTLYWLKDFITFYDFYEKSAGYIQETKDLQMLKAEADAEYEHTVDEELLRKLATKDQRYLEYCCMLHRAELFSVLNPYEENRIYHEILKRAKEDKPIDDSRVIQIVLDTAFFIRNTKYYERLKEIYPADCFTEMQQLGFEDELYGRIEEAERKLRVIFEVHKDYDGTYRILKSFYVRNHKKAEYDALFHDLVNDPPDEMYKQPQFFASRVMGELNDWHDCWNAMKLYARYYDRIKDDMVLVKEIEEALKLHAADYCNYEDRIAWNRYMLTRAPKYARFEIYLSILKLYVANSKYKEASKVLDEMKEQKVPVVQGFDTLIAVCQREQKKSFYCKNQYRPYFHSGEVYLQRLLNEAGTHWRYRLKNFAAGGAEVILPIKYLLCIFRQNRQKELAGIHKIHIMYAGLINLQNSIWAGEDAFLRMILQWIGNADNVVLSAPDFMNFCKALPYEKNINHRAEDVQIRLYGKEHPEYIRI